MYFRLKDNFILRGWIDFPYVIIDCNSQRFKFVDELAMKTLRLFDGEHDHSDEKFIPVIDKFLRVGLIEKCNDGRTISEFQKYKKYNSRYIAAAHWSITGKCNFRCKHCFMSAPDAKSFELSHENIMKIIQQLEECGIMNVTLTGGEPLIRRDFLNIVDALAERHININTIYTNGALVSKNLLAELDKRNIHPTFQISFDGVGWHDWLRGISGAEMLVNNAFSLCRDMGFTTSASMSIHQKNKNSLRDTVNHLAELGVSSLKVSPLGELGYWAENHCEPLSTKELYQVYLDYIPYYYQDNMPMAVNFSPLFIAGSKHPDKFSIPGYNYKYIPEETLLCSSSRNCVYIAPDGRVMTCMFFTGMKLQENFPLITQEKLADCVEEPYYRKFADMTAKDFQQENQECRDCKYSKHCYGGCRMGALMEDENNMMAKSPELCEFFFGGWIEKVIETVKKANPNVKIPDCNIL